jgi:hypothetical protein
VKEQEIITQNEGDYLHELERQLFATKAKERAELIAETMTEEQAASWTVRQFEAAYEDAKVHLRKYLKARADGHADIAFIHRQTIMGKLKRLEGLVRRWD